MPETQLQVLIAEDEPLLAMDLEHVVVSAGHLVVGWATDRDSALMIAGAHAPNLAFVDMRLRDGDTGPEVARRLSARGVSIVITTAHVEDAMKLEGVLGIVPKPCSSQTIRAVLRYAAQRLEGTEAPPPPGLLAATGAAPAASARLKPPSVPSASPLPQPPLEPDK